MFKLFWRATPPRGLLEGWLAAGLLFLATQPALSDAPGLVISMLFLLDSAACAGVAGLRIHLTDRRYTLRQVLAEVGYATALAAGLLVEILVLMDVFGMVSLLEKSHAGPGGSLFFLALSAPGFIAARLAGWVWQRFDRLRRTRFAWALTAAHLLVILLTGGLVLFGSILYSAGMDYQSLVNMPGYSLFPRLVIWVFTLLLIGVIFALAGIAIFMPPSFLFSYFVARRMTARLEQLAQVTARLRSGDLDVRVPVEGQDEVAALQANFNAMAADLQRFTLELKAERDKVMNLLQAQRELAAGVSHELRTPIATAAAYLEVLSRRWQELDPAVVEADLQLVVHETGRLQTLLNDLLTLSQAEVNALALKIEPVDAGALTRQAVSVVATLAWDSRRVQVSADLPVDLPPVLADAVRLEQILLNLLHNAVQHTLPGGLVVVSASQEAGWVRLDIADTGEGIAADDLPHIWTKFYRSRHSDTAGVGLGLALVKEFTEALGGCVGVESVPGEGSVFWVRLPISPGN